MKKILFSILLLIPNISNAVIELSTSGTKIGIGTTSQSNSVSIRTNLAVGSTNYVKTAAPTNGVIIEGNVGIGTLAPIRALDVIGTTRSSAFTTRTSYNNECFGSGACASLTTGDYNAVFGDSSGNHLTTGRSNMIFGGAAGYQLVTGSDNTFIGGSAGYNGIGSNNIFVGGGAGLFETGSNTIIIDAVNRSNEADQRAKSLIYGIMAAAIANQKLTINGTVYANGNVGIGTSIPPNPLYIVGTPMFTTGLNVGIGTASPSRLCIAGNAVAVCNP